MPMKCCLPAGMISGAMPRQRVGEDQAQASCPRAPEIVCQLQRGKCTFTAEIKFGSTSRGVPHGVLSMEYRVSRVK